MIILVDMDETLTQFDHGVYKRLPESLKKEALMPFDQRTSRYIKDMFPKQYGDDIDAIRFAPGFFRDLEPIRGSIDAIKDLAINHDVFLCTSPLLENLTGVQEKYDWVAEHAGRNWQKKIITTKDKTVVDGHYIIDDNPHIKGIKTPRWEHILYDQPYNRKVNKRRLTWDNYREILDPRRKDY